VIALLLVLEVLLGLFVLPRLLRLLGLVAGAFEARGRCERRGRADGRLAGFAHADRLYARFGETAAFAGVIDVEVFVRVPAVEGAAGREEDVAAVRGGIDEVAVVGAPAAGYEEVTAAGGRVKGGVFIAAAAGAGELELIDVALSVFIGGGERVIALEEEALSVIGEIARSFIDVGQAREQGQAQRPSA
jgi:hypothetical protein